MTEKKVIARECKFALHLPTKDPSLPDFHMVKERLYYSDGTQEPNLQFIKDFKRPFWITKKQYRKHNDKKEYEHLEKVDKYESTETRLESNLARVLGKPGSRERLKQLCSSKYVYGADIPSVSFIKRRYQRKWNKISENSLCVLDIETDVNNGTSDPIIVGAVMTTKAIIAVTKEFLKGIDQAEQRLHITLKENIDKIIAQLKTGPNAKGNKDVVKFVEDNPCSVDFKIVDNCIEAIKVVMKQVHVWQPDFLAIWNVNFDMPEILKCLKKYNVNPFDIFCDPRVPPEYRMCRYKEGSTKKVTASGKVQPISPADQWHTFYLSASFYVLDAMCTYRLIRLGSQEKSSYSLDNILNIELGVGKLKLTDADEETGLKWHQVMQERHKIFYTVYNFFDSYLVTLLDMKTKDIAFSITSMVECTPFVNFKRQPQRIVTSLFFYLLEKEEGGKFVLASMGDTGDKDLEQAMEDDEDEEEDDDDEDGLNKYGESVLNLSNWIITLPAHMASLGNKIIKEDPRLRTAIRAFTYDSDATSAYPSATEVANISKGTTKREIIAIEGIEEDDFRIANMNMVMGSVNAMEYSIKMFNAPSPFEILDLI